MNKDELKLFKRVLDVLEEYADTYDEAVEEGHYKLIEKADKVLKKYATKQGEDPREQKQYGYVM